jgi:hypothetical protein
MNANKFEDVPILNTQKITGMTRIQTNDYSVKEYY